VLVQYGRFLLRLSRADLGTSVRTRQPVFDDIREYLPATLELGLASIALGVALAGVMAALQFLIPGSGG
ncbi:MAG: ABC transporter permease, partial [Mesorhizobium sp.]